MSSICAQSLHDVVFDYMINHVDRRYSQIVGVSNREMTDEKNILVEYKEGNLYIMEYYINEKVSFYVINRNFLIGENGRFEHDINNGKMEVFIYSKNAAKAVKKFFGIGTTVSRIYLSED
jgi:hypothetical protein